ncbi:MAG: 3TM-type holin [Bilophila sp.]
MNLNPFSALTDLLGTLSNKVVPDKSKIVEGQNRINEQEVAGAPVSFLRLWRGFLGWVLALLFAWEAVVRPVVSTYWPDATLPPSTLQEIMRLLIGMLGLGW